MEELKGLKDAMAKGTQGEWKDDGSCIVWLGDPVTEGSAIIVDDSELTDADRASIVLLHNLSAPLLRVVEAAEAERLVRTDTRHSFPEKEAALIQLDAALAALREAARGGGA